MADSSAPVDAEWTLLKRQLGGIRRRASVRYPCGPSTTGRLFVDESTQAQEAWAVNLSVSGIGLLIDQHLVAGTPLLIELRNRTQENAFRREARVVHTTPQAPGEWFVGCEFVQPLRAEEVLMLLADESDRNPSRR